MDVDSWGGSVRLNTPAGDLLRQLVATLPPDQPRVITVFDSAAIQICVDATLTSADVDLFSDFEDLALIVKNAGLDQNHSQFYIQVSSELNFRTSPRWRLRTASVQIGHCTFHF